MNTPPNQSLPMHEKTSAADFFIYLLASITLYLSMWRFIELWFEYIRYLFPDATSYYSNGYVGDMRFSVAMLIVVFPVYLGLTWYLRKDLIAHPDKREMRVRKWLLNLTLFVTALTIIIDLITLLNNYLNGDLSIRFFLQTLVVLIVAAGVFSYYFWDLRREILPTSKPSKALAAGVSLVILGSIIGGFFIMGSPMTQRLRRLDDRRVSDLQTINSQILNYWSQKSALPSTLEEVEVLTGILSKDPDTQKPYVYKLLSKDSFELCADFALKSNNEYQKYPMPVGFGAYESWDHEAGEQCFKRTRDSGFYSPKPRFEPDLVL